MIIVIAGHRTLRYGLGKSSMMSAMMLSNKGALQIGATITKFGVAEHLRNYSRAPTVERCGGTDARKAVALVCFDRHYNIISDILSNDDCGGLPQRVQGGWA